MHSWRASIVPTWQFIYWVRAEDTEKPSTQIRTNQMNRHLSSRLFVCWREVINISFSKVWFHRKNSWRTFERSKKQSSFHRWFWERESWYVCSDLTELLQKRLNSRSSETGSFLLVGVGPLIAKPCHEWFFWTPRLESSHGTTCYKSSVSTRYILTAQAISNIHLQSRWDMRLRILVHFGIRTLAKLPPSGIVRIIRYRVSWWVSMKVVTHLPPHSDCHRCHHHNNRIERYKRLDYP